MMSSSSRLPQTGPPVLLRHEAGNEYDSSVNPLFLRPRTQADIDYERQGAQGFFSQGPPEPRTMVPPIAFGGPSDPFASGAPGTQTPEPLTMIPPGSFGGMPDPFASEPPLQDSFGGPNAFASGVNQAGTSTPTASAGPPPSFASPQNGAQPPGTQLPGNIPPSDMMQESLPPATMPPPLSGMSGSMPMMPPGAMPGSMPMMPPPIAQDDPFQTELAGNPFRTSQGQQPFETVPATAMPPSSPSMMMTPASGCLGPAGAMPQLGPYLSVLITRLLDMPKQRTMLGGTVEGKGNGYRVTAYDDNENELDYTDTIYAPTPKEERGSGSQRDLRYIPQILVKPFRGILDLQTDSKVIYLEVSFKGAAEHDCIGKCKIHRLDPRSSQVWPYQLEKNSGHSAHCGLEVKVTEGMRPPGPVAPAMGTLPPMSSPQMLPPTAGMPFGSMGSSPSTMVGGPYGRGLMPGMPSVSAILDFEKVIDIPKPATNSKKFRKVLIKVVAVEPRKEQKKSCLGGDDEDDKPKKPKEKDVQMVGPFTAHEQQVYGKEPAKQLQDVDCLSSRVFVQHFLHVGGEAGEGSMYLKLRVFYVEDVKGSAKQMEPIGDTQMIKISWVPRKEVVHIMHEDPVTLKTETWGDVILSHHLMTDAEVAKSGIQNSSSVMTSVGPSSVQQSSASSAPEPCTSRWPKAGDRVYRADGDRYIASYGWELLPGAVATVMEVDGDGDFKLRNPQGQDSKWIFRKNFMYAQEEPEHGRRPVSGRTGNFPKGSPEEAYEQAAINCDAQNRALLQRCKIHDKTSQNSDPRVVSMHGYRHWDSLDSLFSSLGPNPMTFSDEIGPDLARCYKHHTSVAEEIGRSLPPAFGPNDAILNAEMAKMMFKDDPNKVSTMLRPVICKDPNEIAQWGDMRWSPDPPQYAPMRSLRKDDLETLRLACYHPTQNASLMFNDVVPGYRINEDVWGVSHSLKAAKSLQVQKPWWHSDPRVKDDCMMS